MGYPTGVQEIRRKNSSRYYICFPVALARAVAIEKGETVEWEVKDRDTLIIKRRFEGGAPGCRAGSGSSPGCSTAPTWRGWSRRATPSPGVDRAVSFDRVRERTRSYYFHRLTRRMYGSGFPRIAVAYRNARGGAGRCRLIRPRSMFSGLDIID